MENQLQKINQTSLYRELSLRANKPVIDEEKRTVELAFSSETPVVRWFGTEVLEHTDGAIDGARLEHGAPLLLNHDRSQQIGVVEDWRVDTDRIARATVRFGRGALASEIFQDVVDGIRSGVSCGYRILDGAPAKRDGEDIFLASRWMPFEISIESIPADFKKTGVGRGEEQTETVVADKAQVVSETESVTASAPNAEQITNTRSEETNIVSVENGAEARNEIMDFARLMGEEDMGRDFILNSRSLDELRTALKEKRQAQQKETVTPGTPVDGRPATEIGLSRKETQAYSLLRAINASLDKNWTKAGLEREANEEIIKRVGREPENGGFFVPYEAQTRDLSVVGGMATGAALVGTDHKAESFIDLLRNRSIVFALGAQRLTGLRGDVAIPRQTGSSTAYWVTEGQAPTESQPAFGQIAMTPRTLGDVVEFTRKLLLQSNPSVEQLVYRDIAKVMALGIDSAALSGDGVDKPRGILGTTGIIARPSTGTGTPATLTHFDVVMMEGDLEEANIDASTLRYVSRPGIRSMMKSRPMVAGAPTFLTDAGNRTNGFEHAVSMQVPAGVLIFGDFSQVIVGEWGVLEIVANPYGTGFRAGNVEIRALQSVDVIVRYPTAFVVNTDAR